ncbi:hypothetical protein PILCRDRAFT_459938 [Piloderma croceum F 1598]|uniref:Uncharacterized protein n=1 Tax=Piloderma croceum (strain F 1598) TaxID=765440 RepID=A0A0C3BZT1_PILCF|nr:hypothetical protein PILCRDRAFT_459938 [Piloderma croceum F 1598]
MTQKVIDTMPFLYHSHRRSVPAFLVDQQDDHGLDRAPVMCHVERDDPCLFPSFT